MFENRGEILWKIIVVVISVAGYWIVIPGGMVMAADQNDDHVAALMAKAREQGQVRVLIKLHMPFVPERQLGSPERVEEQRRMISALQDAVLAKLSGQVLAARRYRYAPLLALTVDGPALASLATLPEVAEIREDLAYPPLGP